MDVLDSPLEALAFNYISFGFFTIVNNLWPWVAVITAAVSFWRFRAVSSTSVTSIKSAAPSPSPQPPFFDDQRTIESEISSAEPSSSSVDSAPILESALEPVVECIGKDDGVTKGMKFTQYFENEMDLKEELATEEEAEEMVVDGCGEWWERWDRVLKVKTGEMGWYRYQDLTELNGNVVRLWECRA